MLRNAHKAWSTWSGAALVVVLAAREAMPIIEQRIPADMYDWAVWGLAIATPVLRFIDQGLSDA